MKHRKLRTFHGVPVLLLVMAVFASLMVFSGTVAGASAVLNKNSSDYDADVTMGAGVAVALKENGKEVSGDDTLMKTLVSDGEKLIAGKEYAEKLTVSNTGKEPAFVRVTITRYWERDGKKDPSLDPSCIQLTEAKGWTEDKEAHTAERLVYYCDKALPAGKDSDFATGITIDDEIWKAVTQTEKDGVVTNTYAYNGAKFNVEVRTDAVQTHSGEAAVKSVWGRDVTVSGDSLTLN